MFRLIIFLSNLGFLVNLRLKSKSANYVESKLNRFPTAPASAS